VLVRKVYDRQLRLRRRHWNLKRITDNPDELMGEGQSVTR
jgi:hypothetical protein